MLSRRRFLQLLLAASAAGALPVRAARSQSPDATGLFDDGRRDVPGGAVGEPGRVLVVGAGFAGLAVANALAHAGVEVVVIEGRTRLGGRAWTHDLGGTPVDLGASWIHTPIGNPMSRLAAQLGIARIPADPIADLARFTVFDARLGRLDPSDIVDAFVRTVVFDGATRGLLATLGPRATIEAALQRFLADAGLAGNPRRHAEFAIRFLQEQDASGAAEDVALEWVAHSPALAYGGNERGDFPEGGYVRLIDGLAEGLDVRLGRRVTHVAIRNGKAVVQARRHLGRRQLRNETYVGSHVIVTAPLGVLKAGAIRFEPLLPIPKARAIERLGYGFFEKVALRFAEPFWQDEARTHLVYLSERAPMEFPLFLDLQAILGDPVLVALSSGGFARSTSRMSRNQVQRRVLEILREVYGAAVPEPSHIESTRWARDPFSRGAYSFFPVGAEPADMLELARPVEGRLLFAGEATTAERYGYADGALSTGIREAKRLLRQPEVRLGLLRDTE